MSGTADEGREIVYCSGPLFCPEELGGMAAIARVLEQAGYRTFLPHRDGLEAYVLKLANSALSIKAGPVRPFIDRAIFCLDMYQIVERCGSLVISLNGRVPDEGAVAEAAVAFALGKPMVIYKNDARTAFNGSDNSMITGLSPFRAAVIGDIPAALLEARDRARAGCPGPCSRNLLSKPLREAVEFGARVWPVIQGLNRLAGRETAANALIDDIARLCRECPGTGSGG